MSAYTMLRPFGLRNFSSGIPVQAVFLNQKYFFLLPRVFLTALLFSKFPARNQFLEIFQNPVCFPKFRIFFEWKKISRSVLPQNILLCRLFKGRKPAPKVFL